jgi:hypothetical protein
MAVRFATLIAVFVVIGLGAPPVQGTHSIPNPRWFWDANDDWVPDDGQVLVDAEGSAWTQAKLDRLNAAVDEWSTSTQFDPGRTVSGGHDYYVDGTQAPCWGAWDAETLQVTCGSQQARYYSQDPTVVHHYRITTRDTYTNQTFFTWWYGSTHTGANNVADFQGVVTHELGHWLRLGHVPGAQCLSGTAIETMCQYVFDVDDDSWRWRSLETDDVNAANTVY